MSEEQNRSQQNFASVPSTNTQNGAGDSSKSKRKNGSPIPTNTQRQNCKPLPSIPQPPNFTLVQSTTDPQNYAPVPSISQSTFFPPISTLSDPYDFSLSSSSTKDDNYESALRISESEFHLHSPTISKQSDYAPGQSYSKELDCSSVLPTTNSNCHRSYPSISKPYDSSPASPASKKPCYASNCKWSVSNTHVHISSPLDSQHHEPILSTSATSFSKIFSSSSGLQPCAPVKSTSNPQLFKPVPSTTNPQNFAPAPTTSDPQTSEPVPSKSNPQNSAPAQSTSQRQSFEPVPSTSKLQHFALVPSTSKRSHLAPISLTSEHQYSSAANNEPTANPIIYLGGPKHSHWIQKYANLIFNDNKTTYYCPKISGPVPPNLKTGESRHEWLKKARIIFYHIPNNLRDPESLVELAYIISTYPNKMVIFFRDYYPHCPLVEGDRLSVLECQMMRYLRTLLHKFARSHSIKFMESYEAGLMWSYYACTRNIRPNNDTFRFHETLPPLKLLNIRVSRINMINPNFVESSPGNYPETMTNLWKFVESQDDREKYNLIKNYILLFDLATIKLPLAKMLWCVYFMPVAHKHIVLRMKRPNILTPYSFEDGSSFADAYRKVKELAVAHTVRIAYYDESFNAIVANTVNQLPYTMENPSMVYFC